MNSLTSNLVTHLENPPMITCATLSDEERKAAVHERRKQRGREYYWKNREKILEQQREQYKMMDKKEHAARIQKYRKENKEKISASRKAYRDNNKESFKAYNKKYREEHIEKRLEKSQEYWYANRKHLLEQKKEYRINNKEKLAARGKEYQENNRAKIAQYRKNYYEKNKYTLCYNTINRDCFKSMEQIKQLCPNSVNKYMLRYPFEEHAERYIKRELYGNRIFSSRELYDDCYDAGMLAYLYSIHRCAFMNYEHTIAYIRKMIRIYIICAIVVYFDARNICKANGFREVRLDALDGNKYEGELSCS